MSRLTLNQLKDALRREINKPTRNANPRGINQYTKEGDKHIEGHRQALEVAATRYTSDPTAAKAMVREYINEAKDAEDPETLTGSQADRVADFHGYQQLIREEFPEDHPSTGEKGKAR